AADAPGAVPPPDRACCPGFSERALSRGPIHRRASLRESKPGRGRRVLLRRPGRRASQRPDQDPWAPRGRPSLVFSVQGKKRRPRRDWTAIERGDAPRWERAQGREPCPDLGPAGEG